MKTVVILNAPPGCGKDTIADILVNKYNATKQEFKASLYEETAKFFSTDVKYFMHIATSRKYKDNLSSAFSSSEHSAGKGFTPRAALIHVSEDICKPKYGSDYFGKLAAAKLVDGLNVFSDGGGWWEELLPVIEAADKLLICKLIRPNFNFDGDSRQYYVESDMPSFTLGNICMHNLLLSEGKPEVAVTCINALLATD